MKKNRLLLNKETVRTLATDELRNAGGGYSLYVAYNPYVFNWGNAALSVVKGSIPGSASVGESTSSGF